MKATITKVSHHKGLRRPIHGYGKVRLYFYPESETVMENFLGGRFSRPRDILRPLVRQALVMATEQGMSLKLAGEKWPKFSWSQKAGCRCPCSPGFIMQDIYGYEDIWVDYVLEES